MRRRAGPVQQWVDSIPSPVRSNIAVSLEQEKHAFDTGGIAITETQPKDILFSSESSKHPDMTVSAPVDVPAMHVFGAAGFPSSLPSQSKLARDPSLQSDSSHCSSVESLLELRRADPEAVLLGLGFGGCSSSPQDGGPLSRIPKRFLQPSRLKGIAINDFVRHQQESSESLDSVSLGYRGLTGSPYVAPSEIVQKIMERLREHESHELDSHGVYSCYDQHCPLQQNSKLSVLSPDNRLFLERPRSRSPDMRNKRMILGHRSYAFDCDGDLIEISPLTVSSSGSFADGKENRNEDGRIPRASVSATEGMISGSAERTEMASEDTVTSAPYGTNQGCWRPAMTIGNPDIVTAVRDAQNERDCHPDVRRASDEYCGGTSAWHQSLQGTERRYSDGLIERTDDRHDEHLLQRRRNLKRQPRAIDRTDDACRNGMDPDVQTGRHFRDFTANATQASRAMPTGWHVAPTEKTLPPGEQEVDSLKSVGESELPDNSKSRGSEDQARDHRNTTGSCKNEGGRGDCCCHADGTKCWRKVERIIEENRKLEDLVVKSRKEMAEIRGMLSNVLSVRLEPGF